MIEQRRVTQEMVGRHPHPHHADYPLLPGDIIVGPDEDDGSWSKQAPGLGIFGFVLSDEDVAERTEPAPEARWTI